MRRESPESESSPKPASAREKEQAKIAPYSSPETFRVLEPVPPRKQETPIAHWTERSRDEIAAWQAAGAARSEALRKSTVAPHAEDDKTQAYPIIFGRDDKGATKVIVARKAIVNAHTTHDGVRSGQVPTPVEMRGAGQIALPGGKAVHPDDPIASAADEALAETGINVRHDAFKVRDVIPNRSGEYAYSHTLFEYEGDIDELAARAHSVVASHRAPDDEVGAVRALSPRRAIQDMHESFEVAKTEARKSRLPKRYTGHGQDWHFEPIESVERFGGEAPDRQRQRSSSVLAFSEPFVPERRAEHSPPSPRRAAEGKQDDDKADEQRHAPVSVPKYVPPALRRASAVPRSPAQEEGPGRGRGRAASGAQQDNLAPMARGLGRGRGSPAEKRK